MKAKFSAGALLAATFVLIGCAAGNCRQTGSASEPGAGGQQQPSTVTTPALPSPGAKGGTASNNSPSNPIASKKAPPAPPSGQTVVVYKYDGSQQCGMGKAVSPEEMEKELKGIPVTAREKRPDGMMRIQVCGAATGMANVYTIPASRLADAEKLGFKTWTF